MLPLGLAQHRLKSPHFLRYAAYSISSSITGKQINNFAVPSCFNEQISNIFGCIDSFRVVLAVNNNL